MPVEKITYDIDSSDTLVRKGEEMEGEKYIKKQIIQYAIRQNLTRSKWKRIKIILYIALQNCLGDLDN